MISRIQVSPLLAILSFSLLIGLSGCDNDKDDDPPSNSPPSQPSDPVPADSATDQSINIDLSWICSDPDGDSLTFDVHFGTTTNPQVVSSGQTETNYNLGVLENSATYYWQIVAHDNHTHTIAGPVWSFTTAVPENSPPSEPSTPAPADAATDQSIDVTLSWTCSDPEGDSLTFDVHFGTTNDPVVVSSGETETI